MVKSKTFKIMPIWLYINHVSMFFIPRNIINKWQTIGTEMC